MAALLTPGAQCSSSGDFQECANFIDWVFDSVLKFRFYSLGEQRT